MKELIKWLLAILIFIGFVLGLIFFVRVIFVIGLVCLLVWSVIMALKYRR